MDEDEQDGQAAEPGEIVFSGGVTLPPRGWGGGTDGG